MQNRVRALIVLIQKNVIATLLKLTGQTTQLLFIAKINNISQITPLHLLITVN